jgi:hypothetical protein
LGKFQIRFTDTASLTPVSIPTEIQDWATSPPVGSSIRTRIKATHSGVVTKNNGFYLPDKMKSSASTWIEPFPKPILLHHPEKPGGLLSGPSSVNRDPVGRVQSAQYVDLSPDIRDSWKEKGISDQSFMSSALFDAFIKGELSLNEVTDVVQKYFLSDLKIINDPSYEGLGYIELVASITDPDAVSKVLDGRYLTGSISAATNKAICSICKTDWASDDGPCDHRPGKLYDSSRCVLIAGSFDYSEYSFVNNPADRRSGIVELLNSEGEVVQSFSQEDSSNIPEISFVVSDSTIKEDKQMDLEQVKEILKDHKRYQSIQNLDELISTALKDKDFTVERLFVLLEGAVDADLKNLTIKTAEAEGHKHFAYLDEDGDGSTDWVHIGDDDGHTHLVMGFKVSPRGKNQHIHNLANPLKKISNSEDAVKDFFGDGYEELVGDDVSGHLYAEMLFSLLEDTEDRDITEQLIHDAKLSSKQRKKLPGSTFCGPERSFPVNDCAHYTAALRLIGRYKGPGDKGRIRACIERKGKRLGCTSKKKDSVNVGDFSLGYFDEFSDEEL